LGAVRGRHVLLLPLFLFKGNSLGYSSECDESRLPLEARILALKLPWRVSRSYQGINLPRVRATRVCFILPLITFPLQECLHPLPGKIPPLIIRRVQACQPRPLLRPRSRRAFVSSHSRVEFFLKKVLSFISPTPIFCLPLSFCRAKDNLFYARHLLSGCDGGWGSTL